MSTLRPLLLTTCALVALAGCRTTQPATATPPVTSVTRSPDALETYLESQGHSLVPDGSFDPQILTRTSAGFAVDDHGSLRVYEIDDAGEMAQAVRQIESEVPFSADWALFKGGRLVVVYVGGDASMISDLNAVMVPIE